jgi:hypothetical protein
MRLGKAGEALDRINKIYRIGGRQVLRTAVLDRRNMKDMKGRQWRWME